MNETHCRLAVLPMVFLAGCVGGSDANETLVSHDFDPIAIEAGGELTDLCQSWKLSNDEPLYMTAIRQTNGGGWHHSNWFFVPEGTYPPNVEVEDSDATEEGTWRCEDRGFRERGAAAVGGVLFAQSTQTPTEEQRFPRGAALVIPARSVIVGDTHLLNVTENALDSSMRFDLATVQGRDVTTRLQLVNFSNGSLSIPSGGESRFGMACDMGSVYQASLGTAADYNIYYVLPHYHEWGNYFRLSLVDEVGNEQTVYETETTIGEPLGGTIDPPISSNGARYLRYECGFNNKTGDVLTWGFGGHEMCEFLVYIDGGLKIAGGSQGAAEQVGVDEEGRQLFETQCGPLSAVSDLGGGASGIPSCGAGNTFLAGGSSASQTVNCSIAGAIDLILEAEVRAIPRAEVVPGATIDIDLSARVEIDDESAAVLNTISRGEPAEIKSSESILNFVSGVESPASATLRLTDVPCSVDYSQGAVPVVPPTATARVKVAADATTVDIELAEFTLVTRTPSPSYLTTGDLPDDPMGQILTQCTATEATIQIPVE